MSNKTLTKDKKGGFGKKLFRKSFARTEGSLMSRVLKTLSTLSHFGSEVHRPNSEEFNNDGGFNALAPEARVSVDLSSCWGNYFDVDKVPGVSGLRNHGNTCFMNAVLQCLSNTELLAEYLALGQYRDDISDNTSNSGGIHPSQWLNARDGCEVTHHLSGLVRALWTLEYTPQHSRAFKNAVSKNAMQYRGNAQHDAQEFLLWLLDRVHEDLNSTAQPGSGTRIKPPLESQDGPSASLSTGSFVQELFQAQYRSSLTCPHCQKQSNTFEPFMCISLPIPLPQTRPIYVTIVYQGNYPHCIKIGLAVPLHSSISRLRQAVSVEAKIPPDQFVLTEMYYDGFHRSFCDDDDDLDIIQESDSIFAFETPEGFRLENIRSRQGSLLANLNRSNQKNGTEDTMSTPGSPNQPGANDKMILIICNRACTGHQGRRFGLPFVLFLEDTVTWDALQCKILEKMRHLLRPGVYVHSE